MFQFACCLDPVVVRIDCGVAAVEVGEKSGDEEQGVGDDAEVDGEGLANFSAVEVDLDDGGRGGDEGAGAAAEEEAGAGAEKDDEVGGFFAEGGEEAEKGSWAAAQGVGGRDVWGVFGGVEDGSVGFLGESQEGAGLGGGD